MHEHGVVGLVILLVERGEPIDRHLLDVGAGADGRLAVVVPEVGGRRARALRECRCGLFSPRSNSLRTTVISVSRSGLLHPHVHHAIGFEAERPSAGSRR